MYIQSHQHGAVYTHDHNPAAPEFIAHTFIDPSIRTIKKEEYIHRTSTTLYSSHLLLHQFRGNGAACLVCMLHRARNHHIHNLKYVDMYVVESKNEVVWSKLWLQQNQKWNYLGKHALVSFLCDCLHEKALKSANWMDLDSTSVKSTYLRSC